MSNRDRVSKSCDFAPLYNSPHPTTCGFSIKHSPQNPGDFHMAVLTEKLPRITSPESLASVRNPFFIIGSNPASQHNPFEKTQVLTPPQTPSYRAQISVFGNQKNTKIWRHPSNQRTIYFWGLVCHPDHPNITALSEWVIDTLDKNDFHRFRQLLGSFIIAVDDQQKKRISLINDLLGARPFFTGQSGGRFVGGSDVLGICHAGLSSGQANYDAIASWIQYNQPIDGEPVVTDYQRLPPMAVRSYSPTGDLLLDATYGPLPFNRINAPIEQVVDDSHHACQHSLNTQLRHHNEVNFPLSGGYDSRLLFAIASKEKSTLLHAATLCTRSFESELARQVADALGMPLELLRGRSRILDLFDDPFAFTPSGFVTGRNLTSFLARYRPGMPIVSGFMGDGTMRGSMVAIGNAFFQKDDQNLPIRQQMLTLHERYTMYGLRLQLINQSIRKRLVERAQSQLEQFVQRQQSTTKPLLASDLFSRHRNYYSPVFIQHLDCSEAILPYASWDVLSARVKYATSCFGERNYPLIFARHHPELAKISHPTILSENHTDKPAAPPTRHLRRWSADLAAATIMTDLLDGWRKRSLLKLLPTGLLGETRYEREITFVYKMTIFERSLRKHRIEFDWNRM